MLRSRWAALLVDAAFVLVFAGVGRASHEEGLSVAGVLATAWPFLAGLVVAWWLTTGLAAGRGRGDGDAVSRLPWGATVPVVTWAVGLVLRVGTGQGAAGAFPLVALGFLAVTLVGWRALVAAVRSVSWHAEVRGAGAPRSAAREPGTPDHGG